MHFLKGEAGGIQKLGRNFQASNTIVVFIGKEDVGPFSEDKSNDIFCSYAASISFQSHQWWAALSNNAQNRLIKFIHKQLWTVWIQVIKGQTCQLMEKMRTIGYDWWLGFLHNDPIKLGSNVKFLQMGAVIADDGH